MAKLHLDILGDGSFRTMPISELRRHEYAARCSNYYMAHGPEKGLELLRAAGIPDWETYYRLNDELLARLDAAKAEEEAHVQTQSRPARPMGRCCRCGAEIPKSLLMASSMGLVCPDCYDAASL